MKFAAWNTALLVFLSGTAIVPAQSLLPAEPAEKIVRTEPRGAFTPQLPILVYNFAHVPPAILVEAQTVAAQILAKAGVEPIWINCPGHPECGGETRRQEFRIRILSEGNEIVTHDPLGFAVPCDRSADACLFYVFYTPIYGLAKKFDARPGHVLGQVMTHEVGHALLGPHAHALSGIMQGRLPIADLDRMLYFTPGQVKRLRVDLSARTGAGPN